jgi:acyl carrier protein
MNRPEIYVTLQKVFEDVFNDESLTVNPELSANDVEGWDSITHIRLMLTVEKTFKIKLSASEIGKLQNVGDLVTLITARI